MDQFPERPNLPKLTQGETDNQNGSVCIKEVESLMNSLPKHKAQLVSLMKPTKHLREIDTSSL